ncbi:hypothetical protein Thena_0322 [Thermodesulfobium narugense DSM 14796]|uniref:Uncharacterized protein n=2 Tax=Thermodesulfobium narugense TaxID=184064 RepID=M1E631_9BACT|nr:hypothetical protein Thena_0322 [Thermodesulfobium narugense DSM 14796]
MLRSLEPSNIVIERKGSHIISSDGRAYALKDNISHIEWVEEIIEKEKHFLPFLKKNVKTFVFRIYFLDQTSMLLQADEKSYLDILAFAPYVTKSGVDISEIKKSSENLEEKPSSNESVQTLDEKNSEEDKSEKLHDEEEVLKTQPEPSQIESDLYEERKKRARTWIRKVYESKFVIKFPALFQKLEEIPRSFRKINFSSLVFFLKFKKAKPKEPKIESLHPSKAVSYIIPLVAFFVSLMLTFGTFMFFQITTAHEPPDIAPPRVSIQNPPNNTVIKGLNNPIEIRVEAVDKGGLDKVRLLLNNLTLRVWYPGEDTVYKWYPEKIGTFIFQAIAINKAGNYAESTPVKVIVEPGSPNEKNLSDNQDNNVDMYGKAFIIRYQVHLKEAPYESASNVSNLSYGDEVEVLEKIDPSQVKEGVVMRDTVVKSVDGNKEIKVYAGEGFSIKDNVGLMYQAKLNRENIEVYIPKSDSRLANDSVWYKVRTKDGVQGYISSQYIRFY